MSSRVLDEICLSAAGILAVLGVLDLFGVIGFSLGWLLILAAILLTLAGWKLRASAPQEPSSSKEDPLR